MNKEIEIPEGYEAKIEGNKVILKPKESEDERIRKHLIEVVELYWGKTNDPDKAKDLAYLEKLKERKPVKLNDDTEVGLDRALQIVKAAKGNLCGYQSDDGIYECCHAIQTLERILKNGIEQKPEECNKCAMFLSGECTNPNGKCKNVKPKQEWSDEDETCLEYALWCVMKTRHFVTKDACDLDACRCAERWLNFLPERFNLQPKQEWSEEDKAHIESLLKRLDGMCKNGATFTQTRFAVSEDIDWLKDLRPQPKDECGKVMINGEQVSTEPKSVHVPLWKPTGEQLHAMEAALRFAQCKGVFYEKDIPALESLFYKLKDMYDNNKA